MFPSIGDAQSRVYQPPSGCSCNPREDTTERA